MWQRRSVETHLVNKSIECEHCETEQMDLQPARLGKLCPSTHDPFPYQLPPIGAPCLTGGRDKMKDTRLPVFLRELSQSKHLERTSLRNVHVYSHLCPGLPSTRPRWRPERLKPELSYKTEWQTFQMKSTTWQNLHTHTLLFKPEPIQKP